ncbi:MAG: histidine ammonia-lyase [Phycisphaeraceae bacterium]|nr:histidine ammonia-lyase [Phycisphaeraceae bacterium]
MARRNAPVRLDGSSLEVGDVVAVAREGRAVSLAPQAVAAMKRSRGVVESLLDDGKPHYGINTGFGSLARQRIGSADLATLQRNLVRSHAAGVLDPLPEPVVRAMMLVLAGSLARGMSGVRPVVAERLVVMLNRGVTPIVPSVGSVGASGDLAPLAAIAAVLLGEGRATFRGRAGSGGAALKAAGLKPLELDAKEGLALINGTHLMCAQGTLLLHDAHRLFDAACLALAMSIDACRASHAFLDERLYKARNQTWPHMVAEQIAAMLRGGQIVHSHAVNDPRVQDPYSLRAGPTVLGAVFEALLRVEEPVENELGAVTDNPLVFARGVHGTRLPAIVSGANFHGMPLAMPLDYLAIALCHLAGISERRTYLMTGAFDPESHLKPFLTPRPGLQSGLMIAQYAAAACVNEMIGLATPASVANISTCAGMEDYNSFGPRAAAKASRAIDLARRVVAIELICAAQGVESHRPLKSGRLVERAIRTVRSRVRPLDADRELTPDIEAVAELIAEGAFAADA